MGLRLRIDGTTFRDSKNREVILHGINAAGDAKLPSHPNQPSQESKGFFDGDHVSFKDRPFPVDEAPIHFARLRRWGYNTIRYIFTWEALEHERPGKYDEEFIQRTIAVLRQAKAFGFMVFMDPHQDVWSRFTGGSGAPMWTLYACGLDPRNFLATEAALVQNTWPDPAAFPKMIWATNYTRMACQVVLTMFFAGRVFTPKCELDGINIQDYLQDHFIGACQHLAQRIKEAGDLHDEVVIGWETMNEPNHGLIGLPDMSKVPKDQKLQLGTSPTAWQATLLGSGIACEVETYAFGNLGPYKSGTQTVDPKGERAWLAADYDDSRYGWTRDPDWKLGTCVWAMHGIWEPKTRTLLRSDYFARDPRNSNEIDYEYFTNHYWMPHYRKYRDAIRAVFPDTIMFAEPPPLEIPPSIKGTADDEDNMVYTPHWYDGLTLMTKKWRSWNVDVFGVLRGRYLTPAFAVKIGERAIRNCFKSQLEAIRKEGLDYMGEHPCMFSEFGIPYDMNDGYAYKTGDYSSQTSAMDANWFGIESSKVNASLWNYTGTNNHKQGDLWNGEDLSIYSQDDTTLPAETPSITFTASTPTKRKVSMTLPPASSPTQANGAEGSESETLLSEYTSTPTKNSSLRAAPAYVRPYPLATHGNLISYGFDLKSCTFVLKSTSETSAAESAPTEIFLPEYHFPDNSSEEPAGTSVEVSSGRYVRDVAVKAGVEVGVLYWWPLAGEQTLRIKGATKRAGLVRDGEEDKEWWERCRENVCSWI